MVTVVIVLVVCAFLVFVTVTTKQQHDLLKSHNALMPCRTSKIAADPIWAAPAAPSARESKGMDGGCVFIMMIALFAVIGIILMVIVLSSL